MANKKEFVDKVAELSGFKKQDASKAVNSIMEAIEYFALKGEKVQLLGLGSFEVRERAERKGRNPQTGKEITIKASKSLAFKQGKGIKDALNK